MSVGVTTRRVWGKNGVSCFVWRVSGGEARATVRRAGPLHGCRGSVVIGSEFTALGRQHKQSFPHLTNQDLVMRSAGQPELVWTKDSIRRRNLLLKAFYVGASVLLAVSLLSVVQAIHCSGLPKRNKDVRAHRS